jgi:hypothetical protein
MWIKNAFLDTPAPKGKSGKALEKIKKIFSEKLEKCGINADSVKGIDALNISQEQLYIAILSRHHSFNSILFNLMCEKFTKEFREEIFERFGFIIDIDRVDHDILGIHLGEQTNKRYHRFMCYSEKDGLLTMIFCDLHDKNINSLGKFVMNYSFKIEFGGVYLHKLDDSGLCDLFAVKEPPKVSLLVAMHSKDGKALKYLIANDVLYWIGVSREKLLYTGYCVMYMLAANEKYEGIFYGLNKNSQISKLMQITRGQKLRMTDLSGVWNVSFDNEGNQKKESIIKYSLIDELD